MYSIVCPFYSFVHLGKRRKRLYIVFVCVCLTQLKWTRIKRRFYGITSKWMAKWIKTIFCTTWYKLFAMKVLFSSRLPRPFTIHFHVWNEMKWHYAWTIGHKNGLHIFNRPICFVREFFHFFLRFSLPWSGFGHLYPSFLHRFLHSSLYHI